MRVKNAKGDMLQCPKGGMGLINARTSSVVVE